MPDRVGIAVTGAAGRMGRRLIAAVAGAPEARLSGAVVRAGHPWTGVDVGVAMGGAPLGVIATADIAAAFDAAQVVIDFTTPEATRAFSAQAVAAECAHVIGTTGFAPDDLTALDAAAERIAVVRAGNMSLGVNLLVRMAQQVAAALDAAFDIEIVEAHHRHKVDAPSGTALMLGEAAAQGRGVVLDAVSQRGRDGITGERAPGAIGFSAVRGGDIVGEHDVIFAGPGERVVLRHVATDRAIFARGALRAALWARGRAPGQYDMLDVLGLN